MDIMRIKILIEGITNTDNKCSISTISNTKFSYSEFISMINTIKKFNCDDSNINIEFTTLN